MIATKHIRIALRKYIESLGYATYGADQFPRVEVASLQMRDAGEKSQRSFIVSCTLDCITQSDSPLQSYEVLDNIRTNIEQVATLIDGYDVNAIVFGDSLEIIEDSDFGAITRQEQPVTIYLTQQ